MSLSKFDPEKAESVLEQIRSGQSVRKACEAVSLSPVTFLRWVENHGLSEQYAKAREMQADALFDELEAVAAEALKATTAVEVQARRLVVDTHKWRISKILPRRYGDKLELSGDPDRPVQAVTRIELVAADDDRADKASA